MAKRYYRKARNTMYRRKKRTTKKSNRGARVQQKAASTWVRKKYTKVVVCEINANDDVWQKTISLIGAKNASSASDTYTINEVNQDTQLESDMKLYQFFRIRGVAFKFLFPQPTDTVNSPVQWACAYSQSEVLYPLIATPRFQTMATYQTGGCQQGKQVSRFYNTASTLRRFGIQYCPTSEYLTGNFNTAGDTYGGQLPANQGSSVALKLYRQKKDAQKAIIGRVQITYYVTYKGNKGNSSLVAP